MVRAHYFKDLTGSVANQTLSDLRRIALDEAAGATARLSAIDAIAALGNFYFHRRTRHLLTSYVQPTERGRKFLGRALRRLLKSGEHLHRGTPEAIRTRLLFLKGIEVGGKLHRLDPPEGQLDKQIANPVVKVPDVVSEIEAFLAKHK